MCFFFVSAVRYGRVPKRSRELSGSDENVERDKRKRKYRVCYGVAIHLREEENKKKEKTGNAIDVQSLVKW